jgi:hypothetical protein
MSLISAGSILLDSTFKGSNSDSTKLFLLQGDRQTNGGVLHCHLAHGCRYGIVGTVWYCVYCMVLYGRILWWCIVYYCLVVSVVDPQICLSDSADQ